MSDVDDSYSIISSQKIGISIDSSGASREMISIIYVAVMQEHTKFGRPKSNSEFEV